MSVHTLLVDDDALMARALARVLRHHALTVTEAQSREAARVQLDQAACDTLLVDIQLGRERTDRSGLDVIHESRSPARSRPPVPSVAFTGTSDRDVVRAAYAAGASACLSKQATQPDAIVRALRDAVLTQREPPALRAIAGESALAQALRARIVRFAPSDEPVLITGPPGSGKELVASALHELSGRLGHFVVLNLAGRQNDAMLMSDLFGHLPGAFTGAVRERAGAFTRAANGTLFLDEIGDLPLESQGLLLRAIEARAYAPLGSTRESTASARLVFATNADLGARVKAGAFRQDLLSRIETLTIRTPGLEARRSDIPAIALRFAQAKDVLISGDALEWLERREHVANARTLRNRIYRVAELTDGAVLTVRDFVADAEESGELVADPGPLEPFDAEWNRRMVDAVEAAVAKHGGNESAAAAALRLNRSRLRRIRAKRG